MSEYEYKCGPHEYYHNENNEPMFRGIKVINLSEIFYKVEGSREYTLEQFKEWLKMVTPTDDWFYINDWGRLDSFLRSSFTDFRIFDYLFQLGKCPFGIYLRCIKDIEYYEEELKKEDCEYRDITIMMLEEARELLKICNKYITPGQVKLALDIKDDDY